MRLRSVVTKENIEGVESRFWPKVQRGSASECWPWLAGTVHDGYGRFRIGPKTWRSHRVSYLIANGSIDSAHTIDHVCHNLDLSCNGGPTCQHRKCVNPNHLEQKDDRSNILGSIYTVASINSRKTKCPRGHTYDLFSKGRRYCRICMRARYHEREHRRRRVGSVTSTGASN